MGKYIHSHFIKSKKFILTSQRAKTFIFTSSELGYANFLEISKNDNFHGHFENKKISKKMHFFDNS